MDIKDNELFRLEDRMLFEAAAAAQIVAAADAAQNASDDGNNDEEKHNNDMNVALFVAPEAQNDNDAANNVADVDAQAKALVEGDLPAMDDSISIIPAVDANANTDVDTDAQLDAHQDFVEGTLHADNADTFTVDADADADHDILGNWLANDDIDDNADTLSVDGAVAAIAAEHTVIDIDADADTDADSDDFDADTRAGNHELSLDFSAHKTYDGTTDVEDGELQLDASFDGIELSVFGTYQSQEGSWIFTFNDTANQSYIVTTKNVVFDGSSVTTDSITIGSFYITGENVDNIDLFVNGEELPNTRAGELRADGTIDQRDITLSVRDARMTYGDDENSLKFQYEISEGSLIEGDSVFARYALSSDLDAYRTDSGHIQYNPDPYADAIKFDEVKTQIYDFDGNKVTENYNINFDNGSLTVAQRVLSVTIKPYTVDYGEDLGTTPAYDDEGYTFDGNALALGDTLIVNVGYNITDQDVSSAGFVKAGLHPGMLVEASHELTNASNYIYGVNPGNLTVNAKGITVDYVAANKIYDGNTDALRDTEAGFIFSEALFDGDVVRIFDNAVDYTFASSDVGTGIEVTASDDFVIVGPDADSYDIHINLVSQADITPKDVTITFTAEDRAYDGDTDATLANVQIEGVIKDGDVTIDAAQMTFAFSDKNVGDDKTVTAEGYSEELLGGAKLQNYNVTFVDTTEADITPLLIEIGFSANDKVYDGNTEATRDQLDMSNVLPGDDVSFDDSSLVYNFSDKNVGEEKTVTAEGYDDSLLSGNDVANYDFIFVDTALADITPLEITIGFTAKDKVYDGNTVAERDELDMSAVLEGDDVSFDDSTLVYNFSDKNVGEDKTVTAEGYSDSLLSGKDVANYDFIFAETALADITPLEITIGFTANDKVYDGNTEATRDELDMSAVIEGDDVSFDDSSLVYTFDTKNVGEDKTVTAEGYNDGLLSGKDLANYNITFANTALADITPLAIEIGFTANDKIYDGNTEATRDQLDMSAVLEGDDVSFDDSTLVYNFSDKNVGEDKTVTAEGYSEELLSGNDLANYDVTFVDTTTAAITPLAISIGFTANDKVYDGNTTATRDQLVMDEVLEGDDVSFDDSGIEYNFDTKEPGEDKTVTATGFTTDMLSGKDLANYDITFIDTTTADITYLTITIIADDKSMTYGDSEPALTYSYEGNLAEGHSLSVDLQLDIDDADITNTDHIKAGEYADSITAVATIYDADGKVITSDYTITYDFGNLTVDLRNITVTAKGQSMIYGDEMPALDGEDAYSFDANALASGDTLDVTLTYDITDQDLSTSGNVIAGLHSGMIVEDSHDLSNAENYNYTFNNASLTVEARDVTIIFNAKDKVYDGNADAERDGDFILDGFVDGDKVSVFDNDMTYSFSDKNVGEDKTVTADGELITVGDDVNNYNFTFDNTAEADITPLAIEIGFTANDKVYDGNTTAERVDLIMDQVLEGDDVSFDDSSLEYNFDTKNVGEDKTVTATGYSEELLSGDDLQNYEITFVDTTTADITKLAIEIGFTANNKVYDGNTEATRDELDMSAVLEGDDVSFDDSSLEYNFDTKNVGEDKTVTAEGYSEKLLSGEDLQNYDVTFVDTTTANITPLAIEIGFTAKDKIYDGNTVAERDELDMSAVLEGDDVSFDDSSLEYNFSDKNVGEDKTVTAEGYSEKLLSGEDLQNYDVTFVDTALADITPLAIKIGFTAADKKYDGNTIAERVDLIMDEVLEGDDVSFDDSGIEYNFDTKEPGEGKTVTATGFDADTMLSGNDLANYDITFIDTTTANITYLTITIIADDKSMTYGDSEPALTYTYEGDLAEGHMVSVEMSLNIDAADITDTDHIKVNEYVDSITAVATIYDENGAVVTGDYDIIYDFGDLTVTKRNITVTAQAQEMIYGEDMPDLAGQYTFDENALASGDTLDVTLDYDIQDNDVSTSGNVTAGLHSGMVVEASHDLSNDENYNYTFNAASLNVLPKDVTIIFNAKDKVYDGNTDAERDGAFILDGFVDGDKVNVFDNNVTYSFSDKNVGEDKTVTADGELITVGDDVNNYNFTFDNTAEADITPLAIEIGFTANDKIYDGNTEATRDEIDMSAVLEGDDVSFDDSGLEYNFDTKDVGTDKTVTATGFQSDMLSGDDLANYEITFVDTTTADITKLAIEIGFTANDKVYDGNTEATRDQLVMDEVLEGDDVVFDDSALEYNFDNKNVGTDKTVTAEGYSENLLSGKDVANYDITFVDTTTAAITPLAIEIGFTANDKVYDGNTEATRDELDMSAVLEGDDVSFDDSSLVYNFDTKNVGEDKTVTAEGYNENLLSGADLQNYEITFVDTTTADITKLAIEIGFTANDKVYDGNTEAQLNEIDMSAVLEGDNVSFDDSALSYNFDNKNAGEDKTVTAEGYNENLLSGDDLQNYEITFVDTTTADITKLAIEIGFTANDKVYDGNTEAQLNEIDMSAVLEGDDVSFDNSTLEYNFDTKNAGEDKTVTAEGYTPELLSGDDLQNYDITFIETTEADITPKEIQVGFTAKDKVYDGNTSAERDELIMDGVIEGDDVKFDDTGIEYNFDTKNIGEAKTVTGTGFTTDMLSGDDLQNYDITFADTIFIDTATAAITPVHIVVKADDKSMTYGDAEPTLTYTFDDSTLVGGDMINVSLSLNVDASDYTDSNHIKAGEYEGVISATADIYDTEGNIVTGNYEIDYELGSLTVNLRNITVTAQDQTMTYGDDMPDLDGQYTFDANELAEGDSLDVTLDYEIKDNDVSSSGNVIAGLHSGMIIEDSHVLSNAENYNYNFNGAALDVKAKDITISFNAKDKQYDGNTDAERDGDFIFDGVIDGDDVRAFDTELTFAFDAPNVLRDADGNVLDRTVTATGELITVGKDINNYNITFNDTTEAKITPIALTVTAISQSMTYGDENPDLTNQYTVEGLLDIDTLDVTLTYDSDNIPTSDSGHFKAGEYEGAVIEDSHTLTNAESYDYTFIAADLTVDKRAITIAADDKEITYGDEVGELTYVITGEVADGDSLDDTTLAVDGEENANGHYNAGEYDIIIGELSLDEDDYDITYEPGTLLVNQKEITVIADNKTKEQGKPDPRLTYTVDGLLDDDQLDGRLTREPGNTPGEYEIQQGTLTADDNYIINYIPGILTITEKHEEPEPPVPPRNIYQEPEQSNRNYNGPSEFEVIDYRPIIPDIHPKWDFRSQFNDHRVDSLAESQDLWMDVNSLDTILVSKVISATDSANERGFSSGNEMFPNDTQTSIMSVHASDDFDSPIIDPIDVHGSNDNDMPWIFIDESIQIPKSIEQDIADDAAEDIDMLDTLAGLNLNEPSKHAAFKSDVELLLDGLMA